MGTGVGTFTGRGRNVVRRVILSEGTSTGTPSGTENKIKINVQVVIGTGDGAVNLVGASTCQPDGVRVGTINGSTRYMREFTVAQWVSWEREGDYLEGDGRWSLIPNCKGLWRIRKQKGAWRDG